MPARKKPAVRTKAHKPRKARRRTTLFSTSDDSNPEIVVSVHNFDCTMDPPSPRTATRAMKLTRATKRPRRKDVDTFELKVKMKPGKGSDLKDGPFENYVDAIFLTRKARELWDKYVPKPTRPAPTARAAALGSGVRLGAHRTTGAR